MAQLKIDSSKTSPSEASPSNTSQAQTVARLTIADEVLDLAAKLRELDPSFGTSSQQTLTIDPRGRFHILEAAPAVTINGDRVANTVLADGDCLQIASFTIWFYEAADKRKASDFAITEALARFDQASPPPGLTLSATPPISSTRAAPQGRAHAPGSGEGSDKLWREICATLPCPSALWLSFDHKLSGEDLRSYPFGSPLTIHHDLLSESFLRATVINHRYGDGQQVTARPLFMAKECYGWLLSGGEAEETAVAKVQLDLAAQVLTHYSHNLRLSRQIPHNFTRVLSVLVSMLEAKDTYTAGHSKRVGEMAEDFGRYLGLSPATIAQLGNCGALHDIGKIAIPDHILKKPMPLTAEEFQEMKLHPVLGAAILWRLPGSRSICPGVRHHHEKWDGSGYPDGLKEEDIPFFARIVAIIDSFDALVSGRTYSGFVPPDKALAILNKDNHLYDPKLLTAFIAFRKAATLSKGKDRKL